METQQNYRIFTNDNCTGCNRCISACTVPEANIARLENGENKIYVDPKHCISCAKCIEACPHDARDYHDDTEAFLDNLARGRSIAVLAAPSIRSNFPDYPRLLGLLRSMGVRQIYDTSFGADICTWGHVRYMAQHNAKGLVSQPCPAVVNYVEKHDPELLSVLSPIHSPAMCAAIYMRKYKNIQDEIAFLSPCIAKKDEFSDPNTHNQVQYNVTFRKLKAALARRGLDYRSASPDRFDNDQHGLGAIYPMPGGLKQNVLSIAPDVWVHQVEGQPEVTHFLDNYRKRIKTSKEKPFLVDILNCIKGCNQGTGAICTDDDALEVDSAMYLAAQEVTLRGGASPFRRKAANGHKGRSLEEFDKLLRLDDFVRHYSDKRVRSAQVLPQQLEQAYGQLKKTTPDMRKVNCCSCGYPSCEDMATAIAKGINHPENCVEYHKVILAIQQKEMEELLGSREAAGKELRGNIEKIFEALSENSNKSDRATAQVTQISEEVAGMKDIAARLSDMMDVLNNQLQQYVTMGSQIVSISTMTKLLSMNASVEAAHAKEYGKGFAVVAEQMKSLSEQSASSANNIISSNELVFPMLEEVRAISETLNDRAVVITDSTRTILQSMRDINDTEQGITEAASQILSENT